jgi:hypothetical protein
MFIRNIKNIYKDIKLKKLTALVLGIGCIFNASANCVKSDLTNTAFCEYERFSVWLSCKQKAAVLSMARIGPDHGNENTTSRNYFLDDSATALSCQQSSSKTYASQMKGYDVRHLIAIDHFDDNQAQALQTNTMDLSTVYDNTFIAQITFIGFVITVNERIIEAFKRTFRRKTADEYFRELNIVTKELASPPTNPDLLKITKMWQSINNDYSSETGRMCLVASLTISCVRASLGVVRIF